MINVAELNRIALEEIGIDRIGWIAEADTDNAEWNCYVSPDQGDTFGFNEEEGFRADTSLYWDHYVVKPSVFDGLQDIVLVGHGPAYVNA